MWLLIYSEAVWDCSCMLRNAFHAMYAKECMLRNAFHNKCKTLDLIGGYEVVYLFVTPISYKLTVYYLFTTVLSVLMEIVDRNMKWTNNWTAMIKWARYIVWGEDAYKLQAAVKKYCSFHIFKYGDWIKWKTIRKNWLHFFDDIVNLTGRNYEEFMYIIYL